MTIERGYLKELEGMRPFTIDFSNSVAYTIKASGRRARWLNALRLILGDKITLSLARRLPAKISPDGLLSHDPRFIFRDGNWVICHYSEKWDFFCVAQAQSDAQLRMFAEGVLSYPPTKEKS